MIDSESPAARPAGTAAAAPGSAAPSDDLFARFARARRVAMRRVLGAEPPEDEMYGVVSLREALWEKALEQVYLESWRLGRNTARAAGHPLPMDELVERLRGGAGVPCLLGSWQREGEGYRRESPGCAQGVVGGARVCDWFREALDGLIAGIAEEIGFGRRASLARCGTHCEDVLFAYAAPELRLLPVSGQIAQHLDGPIQRLAAQGVELRPLGVAENRLYVTLLATDGQRAVPRLYFDLLVEHVRLRFPELEVRDATGRVATA
jgi:hypothetical protein